MAQKLLNSVNDRTYQEVEYLKKSLGPVLVAALAEICIRRPADPIEYLGHWLLRWRYNEELKRRDVQNAMDVVKQRQWGQMKEDTSALQAQMEPIDVAKDVPDDIYSKGMLGEETEEVPDTETLFPPKAATRSSTGHRKSSASQKDTTAARLSIAEGGAGGAGRMSISQGQGKKSGSAVAAAASVPAAPEGSLTAPAGSAKIPTPNQSKRASRASAGAVSAEPPATSPSAAAEGTPSVPAAVPEEAMEGAAEPPPPPPAGSAAAAAEEIPPAA